MQRPQCSVGAHLGNVETPTSSFTVPKHDENAGLLDRSSDLVHLRRFLDQRVGHVFMDELDILEDGLGPDTLTTGEIGPSAT